MFIKISRSKLTSVVSC